VSHFSRLQTRLVDRDCLLAALRDLGYRPQEGELEAHGYAGSRARVDIKVVASPLGYDIGFRAGPDGYEVIADWEALGLDEPAFVGRLQQRYAYHATRNRLEAQGFHLVEEHNESGRIHLVLRRMAP
jgi:hypothetical protein